MHYKLMATHGQNGICKSVCWEQVAGKWMKGARLRGSGGSLPQKLVGLGYQQVCGDPEVWGDGITPVPAAHLEGKLHQIVLESGHLTLQLLRHNM